MDDRHHDDDVADVADLIAKKDNSDNLDNAPADNPASKSSVGVVGNPTKAVDSKVDYDGAVRARRDGGDTAGVDQQQGDAAISTGINSEFDYDRARGRRGTKGYRGQDVSIGGEGLDQTLEA